MRKLIIGRHGAHELNALTDDGAGQMRQLAECVAHHIIGTTKVVVCDEMRVEESGEVLAGALGLTTVVSNEAKAGSYDEYDDCHTAIVHSVVELGADVDTLVIVGQLPLIAKLPGDFSRYILGVELPPFPGNDDDVYPEGCAVIIDCEAKTYELIVPT